MPPSHTIAPKVKLASAAHVSIGQDEPAQRGIAPPNGCIEGFATVDDDGKVTLDAVPGGIGGPEPEVGSADREVVTRGRGPDDLRHRRVHAAVNLRDKQRVRTGHCEDCRAPSRIAPAAAPCMCRLLPLLFKR